MNCSHCLAQTKPGERFCAACGHPIAAGAAAPAAAATCSKCGHPVFPTESFCGNCGHSLTRRGRGRGLAVAALIVLAAIGAGIWFRHDIEDWYSRLRESSKTPGGGGSKSDVATIKASAKTRIEEFAAAMSRKDFAQVVDRLHPAAVEHLGGREQFLEDLRNKFGEKTDIRLTISGPPTEPVAVGKEWILIFPTLEEETNPTRKVVTKDSLIAVTRDDGKTWEFLPGDVPLTELRKLIPLWPDQLLPPLREIQGKLPSN